MVVFIVLFVSQQAQCLTLQVARANQTQPNIVTSWTRSFKNLEKYWYWWQKKYWSISISVRFWNKKYQYQYLKIKILSISISILILGKYTDTWQVYWSGLWFISLLTWRFKFAALRALWNTQLIVWLTPLIVHTIYAFSI